MAKVKINAEKGTIQFEDGRELPIPSKYKSELNPSNEKEALQGEETAKIRTQIGRLGPVGEFAFQAGEGSAIGHGAKDVSNWLTGLADAFSAKKGQQDLGFWERQGENYAAKKRANELLSSEISEESPVASTLGKGLGIGADLVATGGMSGARAIPLLSVAEKGTDVIRNPLETAKDAAIGSAVGFAGDKIIGGLSKAAGRRQAMRDQPGIEAKVAESNALRRDANEVLNQYEKQNNLLQTNAVAKQNADNVKAYQNALDTRRQNIITARNQRKALIQQRDQLISQRKKARGAQVQQREADILRIKQEINVIEQEEKAAMEAFKDAEKRLPELKKMAREEHSKDVLENVGRLNRILAKEDRITGRELGVSDFINKSIRNSEYAASKEGREAEKFLSSLFPEKSVLSREDLIRRYEAIEKRIASSNSKTSEILDQFKVHLGERLPVAIENASAVRKLSKPIVNAFEKEMGLISKELKVAPETEKAILSKTKEALRNIPKEDLIVKIQDGTLKNQIKNSVFDSKDFGILKPEDFLDASKKNYMFGGAKNTRQEIEKIIEPANKRAQKQLDDALVLYDRKAGEILNNLSPDIDILKAEARKRIGKTFANTTGKPADVVLPEPPVPIPRPSMPPPVPPINIPPKIGAVVEPPLPTRPTPIAPPAPFTPTPFTPMQAPPLAPPLGAAEKLGESLENFNVSDLLKTKDVFNNPLTKLAGLKFLLGKAALPVEAAGLGTLGLMKALTSPSTVGQVIRRTAKNGGLTGVYRGFDEYAKTRYSTYQNGIIESPEERFNAISEIEKDPLLNLEEKAMLQMKINRGQSLKR